MSYVPDCRTDENYNQKYLNKKDKEFIAGYDYAVEQIINMIENNTNVYPELDNILDKDIAIVNVDKIKILKEAVEDWAEASRDDLITSMIDSMDDDEYRAIKKMVDSEDK